MNEIQSDASDDEIYHWFIDSLEDLGSAMEISENVIRVILDMKVSDDDGEAMPQTFYLLLSRRQLRSVAWSEVNAFDDTDPEYIPPARNPVLAGLQAFSLQTEIAIATARRTERFIVFHRGAMTPSVRAELPPVRGPDDEYP